jgi:hypothetical protein
MTNEDPNARIARFQRPAAPGPGGEPIDTDMRGAAAEVHNRAIQLRSAARQDATIVVARARERGGFQATVWSAFDADAVHLITDLLLKLQGQATSPLDPAFRARDAALAAAASLTSRIEEAIKREDRGQQTSEANRGIAQSGADPQNDGSGAA